MQDSNPYKRNPDYDKILQTPHSILSDETYTTEDKVQTIYLIKTYLVGKFYLYGNQVETDLTGVVPDEAEKHEFIIRESTLTELKEIIKRWIVGVAIKTGMSENFAQEENAQILPFGSHRLGVNSRGGDIDSLVLCPNYVNREEHFFEDLFNMLAKEPNVTELVKVNDPKVLVPVIKMNYRDIPIDLGFSRLDVPKIEGKLKNITENHYLVGMDEKMVYSFNGPRNIDGIIKGVDPNDDLSRISNFRTTLKLLKLWAKNRGIYSNAMGYLMGISLAILVAKICQMFPNLLPNKLIEKFFLIYSEWDWENVPVLIEEVAPREGLDKYNEMQWYDPKSEFAEKYKSKRDLAPPKMMVITPAFPCMSSTFKINNTTLPIIQEQVRRGKELLSKSPINWDSLFEKTTFFKDYNNFIEVCILGENPIEYSAWKGYVESQMIGYTRMLETQIYNTGANLFLHPYPEGFEGIYNMTRYNETFYYALRREGKYDVYVDFLEKTVEFLNKLQTKRQEGNLTTSNVRILHLLRDELPTFLVNPNEKQPTYQPPQPMQQPLKDTNGQNKVNGKRNLGQVQDNEVEPNMQKKLVTDADKAALLSKENASSLTNPEKALQPETNGNHIQAQKDIKKEELTTSMTGTSTIATQKIVPEVSKPKLPVVNKPTLPIIKKDEKKVTSTANTNANKASDLDELF